MKNVKIFLSLFIKIILSVLFAADLTTVADSNTKIHGIIVQLSSATEEISTNIRSVLREAETNKSKTETAKSSLETVLATSNLK